MKRQLLALKRGVADCCPGQKGLIIIEEVKRPGAGINAESTNWLELY